jgi:DNA (cytosine-5)-methyltransferase 1
VGYHRAGFEVFGVDNSPQPRYPFEFAQADAFEFLAKHAHAFDVIHASPKCQGFSVTASLSKGGYPDQVGPIRRLLQEAGKPYVIENVPGAPLENPIMLCGTMFGLRVIRHRLFETWPVVWWPPAQCHHQGKVAPIFWGDLLRAGYEPGTSMLDRFQYISVVGNSNRLDDCRQAMGIDWMTRKEMTQAIPPVYTEWLGGQLIELLNEEGT